MQEGVLINLRPPEHTQIRRMHTGHLTAQRLQRLDETIRRIMTQCLDEMRSAGSPADLIEAFAGPLASLLCELLGIPGDDRHLFERITAMGNDPTTTVAESRAVRDEVRAYCRRVIPNKRAEPGDDEQFRRARGAQRRTEVIGIAIRAVRRRARDHGDACC